MSVPGRFVAIMVQESRFQEYGDDEAETRKIAGDWYGDGPGEGYVEPGEPICRWMIGGLREHGWEVSEPMYDESWGLEVLSSDGTRVDIRIHWAGSGAWSLMVEDVNVSWWARFGWGRYSRVEHLREIGEALLGLIAETDGVELVDMID